MDGMKRGLIVLAILFVVGAVGIAGCVSYPTPTATPTTPTTQPTAVPTAAPTAQPTAVPTATPPAPKAPDSTGTLTPAQLTTIESSMESSGYTVIEHLKFVEVTGNGWNLYQGMFSKAGTVYGVSIVQTSSSANAKTEMPTEVSVVQSMGFTGSYGTNGSWSGSKLSDSGSPEGCAVIVSGSSVITTFAE